MNTSQPTTLLLAALLLGAGLYLIQRGRFLVPALMHRIPALARRPRLARALFLLLLTLGILAAGMGCRMGRFSIFDLTIRTKSQGGERVLILVNGQAPPPTRHAPRAGR